MTAAQQKPRIRFGLLHSNGRYWHGWRCDGSGCTGFAVTPAGAYANWRMECRQARAKR